MNNSDRKNPTNPQRLIVHMTSIDFRFEPSLWPKMPAHKDSFS